MRDLPGGGKEVIVSSQGMGVAGFDFNTGTQNWLLPDVMKQRTIVSPIHVLSGDECLVAVGCKSGTYFALRPPSEKGSDPKIVWKMKGNTPYVPTPVSDGKMLYAVSDGGVLSALDAKSGQKKWEQKLMGNFYASPLIAGGKLYSLSREGEMIVAEVGNAYREISRTSLELGDAKWADATPAIAHGNLYVRIGSRLDCFTK